MSYFVFDECLVLSICVDFGVLPRRLTNWLEWWIIGRAAEDESRVGFIQGEDKGEPRKN